MSGNCPVKRACVAVHYSSNKEAADAVAERLQGDGHVVVSGGLSDASYAQELIGSVPAVVCFVAATKAGFMTGGIIDINGASYLRG
jgi:hypothetical protein